MKVIIALLILIFMIAAEAEITSSGTEVYQGNPPWTVDANITNGSLNVNVLNPTSGTVSVNGTIPVSVINTVTVQGTTASIPKVSDFSGTLATTGTIAGPIDMAEYPIMYLQISGLDGVVQIKWYNDSLTAIAGLNTSPNNAGTGSALPLNISSNNTYVIPKQGRYAVIQKTVHTSGTVTVAGHLSSVASPLLNLDVSSRQAGNYIVRAQDSSGNSLTSTNGSLNVFVQFPSSQGVFGTMGRSWVLLDSTDSVSVPGVSTAANQVVINGHLSDLKGSLGIANGLLGNIFSSTSNIEGSLGVLNTDKATATNQNTTNSHLSDIKGSLGSSYTQLVNLNSAVAKEAKQDTQITSLSNIEGSLGVANSHLLGIQGSLGSLYSGVAKEIKQDTQITSLLNLEGSLGISNSHLLDIKGSLGGTNSKLDTANVSLTNIQGSLGSSYVQETATNTNLVQVQGSLATTNSQLSSANTNLSDIEGSLGVSHGKMDTGNGHLSDIKGSLGASYDQQALSNTNLTQIQGSLAQANQNLSDIEGSLGVNITAINNLTASNAGSLSAAIVNLADIEGSLGIANTSLNSIDNKVGKGIYNTALPDVTAGSLNTVQIDRNGNQIVTQSLEAHTYQSRTFAGTVDSVLIGTTQTPLCLLRNFSGSGKTLKIFNVVVSGSGTFRFYSNPTISANGTVSQQGNQYFVSGTQGNAGTMYTSPTITTNGTMERSYAVTAQQGALQIPIRSYIIIPANNALLITGQMGANNTATGCNIEWMELTP